jgi:hypothetical protein
VDGSESAITADALKMAGILIAPSTYIDYSLNGDLWSFELLGEVLYVAGEKESPGWIEKLIETIKIAGLHQRDKPPAFVVKMKEDGLI